MVTVAPDGTLSWPVTSRVPLVVTCEPETNTMLPTVRVWPPLMLTVPLEPTETDDSEDEEPRVKAP